MTLLPQNTILIDFYIKLTTLRLSWSRQSQNGKCRRRKAGGLLYGCKLPAKPDAGLILKIVKRNALKL